MVVPAQKKRNKKDPELGGEKSHGKLGLLWIMKIIKSDADLNFVVSLSFGTKTSRQAWSKKI